VRVRIFPDAPTFNERFAMISCHPFQRFWLGAMVPVLVAMVGQPGGARAASKFKVTSVADYSKCVDRQEESPDTCLDALETWVKAHPEQAFVAGKSVRQRANQAAAVPYFARALAAKPASKKGDKSLCADPDITLAVVAGLSLPGGEGSIAAAAQTILFNKCWDEIHQAVLKELAQSGSSGYMAQNLCPTLAEKKQSNPSCEKKAAPPAPEAPNWKDVDPKGLRAEGPAKAFKGSEGRSVTLVKLAGQGNAYVIKFDGFRGEWNGRIVLHREAPAGSGYNYVTQVEGAPWTGLVVRGGAYEAYPLGDKGPFDVWYDEGASKGTNPQGIIDQFVKQPR